mgnify:FL=1
MDESYECFITELKMLEQEMSYSFSVLEKSDGVSQQNIHKNHLFSGDAKIPPIEDWDPPTLEESQIAPTEIQESDAACNTSSNKNETYLATLSTKNIVKNYGNAIASFCRSRLALPYLQEFLKSLPITVDQFQEYIASKKNGLCNINNFRRLLQEDSNDSEEEKLNKKIFRKMGEIFVKYFSVNWIFNSRLKHREAHLKYRFKMLRRIQKPELFTYLNEKPRI